MEQPILSIIVIMHNNAATLANCINSFYKYVKKEQVEIICVDDHSMDNSVQIASSYNDISVYQLDGHGAGPNRNCGIMHSHGKYIWFIDADDKVEGSKIVRLINKLKNADIDLYVFGMMKVSNNKKSVIMNNTNKIYYVQDDDKRLKSIFKENTINSPCNKFYKRSLIVEYNLRFDNISSGEDTLFNCKYLTYVQTIETLNEVLYLYYIYSDSSSKWKWVPNKDEITLKMLDALKDFSHRTNFMSSVIMSRIATDSAVGSEINILNKKQDLKFYKSHFKSKSMKRILNYCKPFQTHSLYYFIKSIIANSLYLSYFYIRGIHNA